MDKIKNFRSCKIGIWNSTIPGISFDKNGVSNYAKIQESLIRDYPKGEKGLNDWKQLIKKIKKEGKDKIYDCLIGVSGGTDSSYLLYIAREYGLRPLAVNLDNGWNSDIAVKNIKKVTAALDIDLETYVIDYEEIKDLLRTYMRARLPWIDFPTDLAIHSVMYKIAKREKTKYILFGSDFSSEGKQPSEWTYSDQKQLRYLHKKFGQVRLKTYPLVSLFRVIYFGYLRGIKQIYPFYYLDYDKNSAREFLINKYNWQYYGEHHHENLFTKWAISYWMYEKFGIDKRLITYSAQIMNDKMSRDNALEIVSKPPFNKETIASEIEYVLKKLELNEL